MNIGHSLKSSESGMALPAALMMILMIASVSVILSRMSVHNLSEGKTTEATNVMYLAAEGAINQQIGEMSVLGTLWEQRPSLSSTPSGYTEYSPLAYSSTNGIPACTGIACHRNYYPIGGGILKNLGPIGGDGDSVNASYAITDQLDPTSLPEADLTLSDIPAWTQVERLDETTPSSATVGGTLSNSVAEGGNAKAIRYRITGTSTKKLHGSRGYSTIVAVVEMPLT